MSGPSHSQAAITQAITVLSVDKAAQAPVARVAETIVFSVRTFGHLRPYLLLLGPYHLLLGPYLLLLDPLCLLAGSYDALEAQTSVTVMTAQMLVNRVLVAVRRFWPEMISFIS